MQFGAKENQTENIHFNFDKCSMGGGSRISVLFIYILFIFFYPNGFFFQCKHNVLKWKLTVQKK